MTSMNLKTNDAFIEHCAREYFNSYTVNGTPAYLMLSFEHFLDMKVESLKVS